MAAVRELAGGAGHVVGLMERVRGGVDEIRAANQTQERGNEVVKESAVTLRDVSHQVRGCNEEQSYGIQQIREAFSEVRGTVKRIERALEEQAHACGAAQGFMEAVRGRTPANEESSRTMDAVTKELLVQAEGLRDEVRRFEI